MNETELPITVLKPTFHEAIATGPVVIVARQAALILETVGIAKGTRVQLMGWTAMRF